MGTACDHPPRIHVPRVPPEQPGTHCSTLVKELVQGPHEPQGNFCMPSILIPGSLASEQIFKTCSLQCTVLWHRHGCILYCWAVIL